jgi:hypothetical protein
MGSFTVVVLRVGAKNPVQMSSAEHHDPVQALVSHGLDPALGERVGLRRANGREDDFRTFGLEHGIERAGEPGVTVANEEMYGCRLQEPGKEDTEPVSIWPGYNRIRPASATGFDRPS